MSVKVCIVVAMAENRVIGQDNDLPWRIPEDLKYFKNVTMGLPLVMGRKTFESIGKPLPGRPHFIVTRNKEWSHEGVSVSSSLEGAIEAAKAQAERDGKDRVMIVGGAEIYLQVLPQVDRLYLTRVHCEIEGDAFFPELNYEEWNEVSRKSGENSGQNGYEYSFFVYEKTH